MAIYKPSNFYPHLQEVDLTKTDGNVFSCQVNTDGGFVAAARLTISSEDNILLYENLYQFADDAGNNFIENRGFLELLMAPYVIDSHNINFDTVSDTILIHNKKRVIISNIDFITLHPDINYEDRIKLCPYNFYNVKLKDTYSFGLKIIDSNQKEYIYSIEHINLNKNIDKSYNIEIIFPNELEISDLSNCICSIILLNDKDYIWDVKLYEHLFNEIQHETIWYKRTATEPYIYYDMNGENGKRIGFKTEEEAREAVLLDEDGETIIDDNNCEIVSETIPIYNRENKGTFITDGYVTGSTKTVLWWDENEQTPNTLFNKKEIQEDYYIEVTADKNNSDLFEDQVKMGRISEGILTAENINPEKTYLMLPSNIVDVEMYKMENIFLLVTLTHIESFDSRIKPVNYFKIKKIFKEGNYTYLELEDLIVQNLLFDLLTSMGKYYRRGILDSGSYIYYDEYGTNGKRIGFETEEEANSVTVLDKDKKSLTNCETVFITGTVNYSIIYKQREKITWITKDLGFEKNINKIEVENDFDVTLNDNTVVDIYGGNNYNTNYSFFGVRDSDLNVDDIYVRFPGYRGADFNGNAINDNQDYYNEKGEAIDIYNSDGKPVDLTSDVGLKGNFHQQGTYYSLVNDTVTSGQWDYNVLQPISLYGKNVSAKAFENNLDTTTFGYIDVYNPENLGTSYCNKGFSIYINGPGYIYINGDRSYASCIPWNPRGTIAQGSLFFYIDSDNEWSMYAIGTSWGGTDSISSDMYWQFPDFPEPYMYNQGDKEYYKSPDVEDQVAKRYKIGKINYIEMDFYGDSYAENYSQYMYFYYYDSADFVGNSEHEGYITSKTIRRTSRYSYFYPQLVTTPISYCKLFKVTSYDYETGEFVIAGGLERSILNTDKYEIWQRTASENMNNEYNITEINYNYTRLYPPHDAYNDVAFVGDTKILNEGIKIMNNTTNKIFIQPNVNFYSDEYNYPYLILDNYNERIDFPYKYKFYDDGLTIQDRTINTLDGSQWLLEYNSDLKVIPKSGYVYKLYLDTCKTVPSNWFYGRNIANITMRVGEYNYIKKQIDNGYVRKVDFNDFKNTFNNITDKKIGKNCLVQCVDAYFMATYDFLSTPVKRYKYKFYDSNMNLIIDSGYVYDTDLSYAIKGLRNEEIYLLDFELEDQLGYVYKYQEKFIVKYVEYETNSIQLQLTVKESQGCILGDFVIMKKAADNIVAQRNTYDENGNQIKKGDIISKNTIYAELCNFSDFQNFGCNIMDDIYVYRRNTAKLLSFVCKINLTKDKIITGKNNEHRYGFIDYGVYNNEYYDYVVVLKQEDLSGDSHFANMKYTYTENRCKTCFNGWILVDIERNDSESNYYVSDFVWNFKYNLESQDLTQNTSVTQWDTLGEYANVYVGQKNYMSSGLTCLLGDVGNYFTYDGENIKQKFGYFEQPYSYVNYEDIYNIYTTEVLTNSIDKYLEWKDFVNNGNPKLLKDYKGNIWIVQILENPTAKNADNSKEQIYTISFNWVEIMDWKKYPILGKNISYDVEEATRLEVNEILGAWNYTYNDDDINYNLVRLNDVYDFSDYSNENNPFIVNGIVTLESKSIYGILNESYYENESNQTYFSTLSNDAIQTFYNSNQSFVSPFMILDTSQSGDYKYPETLNYINFEQNLGYENNSIDFICCGMEFLRGVDIILGDGIKTARYAFAKTKISINDRCSILINTNNYINTFGMLDDIEISEGQSITIRWLDNVDDPDLITYAELYEQYWSNEQVVLDCPKLNFVLSEWSLQVPIEDIIQTELINEEEYKKIILKSYNGPSDNSVKTSLYIPKFIMIDGVKYVIELAEDFYIR